MFWMPRAMRSGSTLTLARASHSRGSSTKPVTVTPGSRASACTSGLGREPTIESFAAGKRSRRRGRISRTNHVQPSTFGR
ncbi:MAG: hypothetical protein NTV21_02775 [Planctomycetota bacterium]|nr:hypothetical protein [Planctomycetota bacterium]